MPSRLWPAGVALLLIGSACSSSFAKDNPQLCTAEKVQLVKDYLAKGGLTPQAAADKAGTDARCLTADETTQAQASYAAFKAQATTAPTPTAAAAAITASPSPSPTATPTPSPTPTATPTPTAAPTQATTEAPATPAPAAPTPKPTPSPTPSPSPTPTAGAGWPTRVAPAVNPLIEAPINGRLLRADGSPAVGYCVILSGGSCAVTTDATGAITLKFLKSGTVDIFIKGIRDPVTGDGPVVYQKLGVNVATGIDLGTITLGPGQ